MTTLFGTVDELHPEGHNRLDLACAEGESITTPMAGVVAQVGTVLWSGPGPKMLFDYVDAAGVRQVKVVQPGEPDRGGNIVQIIHEGPFLLPSGDIIPRAATLYCHLLEVPPLDVNRAVQAGEVIGRVGTTGVSTGPHLHFALAFATPAAGLFPPDMSKIPNLVDPLPFIGGPGGDVPDPSLFVAPPVWSPDRTANVVFEGARSPSWRSPRDPRARPRCGRRMRRARTGCSSSGAGVRERGVRCGLPGGVRRAERGDADQVVPRHRGDPCA